jgi:hypothetical protein
MITTLNLAILGLSIVGWIAITAPKECPLKYMKTIKKGGVLEHPGQIHNYCRTAPLPYGHYYWVLISKEE